MNETQEGSLKQPDTGEELSSSKEPAYRPDIPPADDSFFTDDLMPGGEIGEEKDVVEDSSQEINEDATAPEEEVVKWQASHSPDEAPPRPAHPSSDEMPLPRTTAWSERAILESRPGSSDILESSGEAGDAVEDSVQAGRDSLAQNAEDRSADQAAAQNRTPHPDRE